MEDENTNYSAYVVGGLVGAAIGVLATYLIEKSGGLEEGENPFSFKRLSKLGFGTVSVLWGLINPGKGKGAH